MGSSLTAASLCSAPFSLHLACQRLQPSSCHAATALIAHVPLLHTPAVLPTKAAHVELTAGSAPGALGSRNASGLKVGCGCGGCGNGVALTL